MGRNPASRELDRESVKLRYDFQVTVRARRENDGVMMGTAEPCGPAIDRCACERDAVAGEEQGALAGVEGFDAWTCEKGPDRKLAIQKPSEASPVR
jgi:hypothetical protein